MLQPGYDNLMANQSQFGVEYISTFGVSASWNLFYQHGLPHPIEKMLDKATPWNVYNASQG